MTKPSDRFEFIQHRASTDYLCDDCGQHIKESEPIKLIRKGRVIWDKIKGVWDVENTDNEAVIYCKNCL